MISKHTLIIAFLLLILSMTACSSSAPAASDPECLTHGDMELTVASAKRSEEDKVVLTYALTNHSKEEYHFGRHFKMEYKKDGTWVEISEYFAQTDDMLMIPASETIALDAAFLS